MSEKEKEKYFVSGIINYTSCDKIEQNNIILNNIFEQNKSQNNITKINNSINNYNSNQFFNTNNLIKNLNINHITNPEKPKLLNLNQSNKNQNNDKTDQMI